MDEQSLSYTSWTRNQVLSGPLVVDKPKVGVLKMAVFRYLGGFWEGRKNFWGHTTHNLADIGNHWEKKAVLFADTYVSLFSGT
jgi:hypothetical protein